MKRWFLAVAALLGGTAVFVHADYVIIKVNLAATKDKDEEDAPANAFGPGGAPVPGGPSAGFPPAGTGEGRGSAGLRPGTGGFKGGTAGGPDGPAAGPSTTGARRGSGGQVPGPGMRPGARGGTQAPGASTGDGPAGSFTSRPSGGEDDEPDSTPLFVGAIVEVEPKDITKYPISGRAKIKHRWGETRLFVEREIEWKIIQIPTVKRRYEELKRKIKPEDPAPVRGERLLELAEWALAHGISEREGFDKEIPAIMKELASIDANHPAVKAFQKVQADMDRDIAQDDEAFTWKDRLGDLKFKRSKHYTLLYDVTSASQVDHRLKRLEQNYQGFYYWFALRGTALRVPDRRLVAVLLKNKENFERHQRDVFEDAPIVEDGFFARREHLAVFSAARLDEGYEALREITQKEGLFQKWNRESLLKGEGAGRGVAINEVARAQTMVLLLKAMQEEGELASVSHEGTRQLIAAAGLLPNSVEIPQWIDFGMASFFETPKGSFWPGTGAPNMTHLINYKLWENTKQLEKDSLEALKSVVTDRYFHRAADSKKKEAALNKARTMTWALTYFLAEKKRDGLLRYYEELSSLPRDLEFDEEVLLTTFARAFGLMDEKKAGEIDATKLKSFASQWYDYMKMTQPEVVDVLKKAIEDRKKGAKGASAKKKGTPGEKPGDDDYIP